MIVAVGTVLVAAATLKAYFKSSSTQLSDMVPFIKVLSIFSEAFFTLFACERLVFTPVRLVWDVLSSRSFQE